ncbi:MAG TPA: RsmG family class I SAM-dependent methyltransferase [Acidimicrobiales bacterium]|nr:RsmG family class I SAM-dependent methyltransferase [Acidimicrobiales bacterium]
MTGERTVPVGASDPRGDEEHLLALLARAQEIGAIGPAPVREHVAHAAAFVEAAEGLVPEGGTVLDLGTGGGLPGLVVAQRIPATAVTLLDGRTQRAGLVSRFVEELGWTQRVRVIAARAEEAGRDPELRARFDLVVARGFGRPGVTAECAAPFLHQGGWLIVSEPPTDGTGGAERWPADGCLRVGLELRRTSPSPWSLALLQQIALCPARYPRRVGIPAKRPLF